MGVASPCVRRGFAQVGVASCRPPARRRRRGSGLEEGVDVGLLSKQHQHVVFFETIVRRRHPNQLPFVLPCDQASRRIRGLAGTRRKRGRGPAHSKWEGDPIRTHLGAARLRSNAPNERTCVLRSFTAEGRRGPRRALLDIVSSSPLCGSPRPSAVEKTTEKSLAGVAIPDGRGSICTQFTSNGGRVW